MKQRYSQFCYVDLAQVSARENVSTKAAKAFELACAVGLGRHDFVDLALLFASQADLDIDEEAIRRDRMTEFEDGSRDRIEPFTSADVEDQFDYDGPDIHKALDNLVAYGAVIYRGGEDDRYIPVEDRE